MDNHSHSSPAECEAGGPASSNLRLLDVEHITVFRNALDKILVTAIAETTFSEIIDGLPTKDSWLEFDVWREGHPVNVLNHTELPYVPVLARRSGGFALSSMFTYYPSPQQYVCPHKHLRENENQIVYKHSTH